MERCWMQSGGGVGMVTVGSGVPIATTGHLDIELVSKVVRTLRLMPHPSEFVPTRPTPDCVRWLSTPPTMTFEMTS